MKIIRIVLCFLIILTFASCGKSEFMNLYAFTENYNKTADYKLNISDFAFKEGQKGIYTAFLGDVGNEILLTTKSKEDDTIEEIQMSLIKEKNAPPSYTQTDLFRNVLMNTISAFCSYEKDQTDNIISALTLYDNGSFLKNGELTLKQGNFYFVYYSTDLISQVMIYNTYLHKIEATEKPVSKPYFSEDFIIKETP